MSKKHVSFSALGLWVLAMAVVLWATSLFALTPQKVWLRTYGGTGRDGAYSLGQTSDGGYIMAGETYSYGAGENDVYLIKTDAVGDTVWTRSYGGTGWDCAYSVQQTSDGGYIIAGETTSFGAGELDVYLIRTDPDGDTLWTRTFGDTLTDGGSSVLEASGGGYVIAGYTDLGEVNDWDLYLIKVDAGGETIWEKTYGDSGADAGLSVQEIREGGYIIAGTATSWDTGYPDVYLVKTDENGDTLWTRKYGGPVVERGYSVQETSDRGYIVTGDTFSFGAGWNDVYLIRTDPDGDTLWTRTYGGPEGDGGLSVDQTSDGGYIVGGYTESFGADSNDVYVIRTDTNGDVVWTRAYGGVHHEFGEAVLEISDGKYILAGMTSSSGAGNLDVCLIKIREHNWQAKDTKLGPPAPSRGDDETVVALSHEMPARLALHRSSPNPFTEATLIRFDLPEQGEVNLSIHDVQGRLVKELVGETRPAGSYSIAWDGRDFSGADVPGGIYFMQLESGGRVATGKVVAVR